MLEVELEVALKHIGKDERRTLIFKREIKKSVNNLYFIEMKGTTRYRLGTCMFQSWKLICYFMQECIS